MIYWSMGSAEKAFGWGELLVEMDENGCLRDGYTWDTTTQGLYKIMRH